MKKLIIILILMLMATAVYAGSTAGQVQFGYLTTSGCSGGQSYCWLPYNSSHPLAASSN